MLYNDPWKSLLLAPPDYIVIIGQLLIRIPGSVLRVAISDAIVFQSKIHQLFLDAGGHRFPTFADRFLVIGIRVEHAGSPPGRLQICIVMKTHKQICALLLGIGNPSLQRDIGVIGTGQIHLNPRIGFQFFLAILCNGQIECLFFINLTAPGAGGFSVNASMSRIQNNHNRILL